MRNGSSEVLSAAGSGYELVSPAPAVFRRAETIVLAYFVYVALAVSVRRPSVHLLIAWAIPLFLAGLIALQSRYSRGWSRVTRDWAALGLILIAYREIDWFAGPPASAWQGTWVNWDRWILNDGGLRAAIESMGWVVPSGLEFVYLLLYAIPPFCMGALYWNGQRSQIDRFLTTLFLGTCCAYALLPYFPSVAPRVAFPDQDLPTFGGIFRSTNLWLFEHGDISTSVFPSGHVAVAFSAAFGMMRALPAKRHLWMFLFGVAIAVFIATIYCRYHYAVDGLASIGVTAVAWIASEAMDRDA